MITVHYGNKRYGPIPESYNELTGAQLIQIAGLFAMKRTEDELKYRALQIFLNNSMFSFAMIPNDAKDRMLPFVEWVFAKNQLTEQLLPWHCNFAGPKKEFQNLKLAEFHFTEMYYRELIQDKDDSALNRLIAVMYRKEKTFYNDLRDKDGDSRVKFNSNEIEYYCRIIKRWPANVKLAILFYYDGCRQHLLDLYEEVFQGDGGEENEEGMYGVMRGLAGPKFGTLDAVEEMYLHTALNELKIQKQEAEEMERLSKAS